MFMSREDELQVLVDLLPQAEDARRLIDSAYNYGFDL
jgi:hypothetical protein